MLGAVVYGGGMMPVVFEGGFSAVFDLVGFLQIQCLKVKPLDGRSIVAVIENSSVKNVKGAVVALRQWGRFLLAGVECGYFDENQTLNICSRVVVLLRLMLSCLSGVSVPVSAS